MTSGPKSNFIWGNIPTKAILFFFGCSEVNSTWLITSELANQRARKVLVTCVVYTKQLLDEVERDIMNYQDRGLCYLPKPNAGADNTDTRF